MPVNLMPFLITQNSCGAVPLFRHDLEIGGHRLQPSDHLAQLASGGPP